MHKFQIDIPSPFLQHVEMVQARLAYLYPDIAWSFDPTKACLTGTCEKEERPLAELRKEIFFQIYREKIQHDTLSIRRQIHKAIKS